MSTRSSRFYWELPTAFARRRDWGIHVYREMLDGKTYVEVGRAYSRWTFEWPRLWRRYPVEQRSWTRDDRVWKRLARRR